MAVTCNENRCIQICQLLDTTLCTVVYFSNRELGFFYLQRHLR